MQRSRKKWRLRQMLFGKSVKSAALGSSICSGNVSGVAIKMAALSFRRGCRPGFCDEKRYRHDHFYKYMQPFIQ